MVAAGIAVVAAVCAAFLRNPTPAHDLEPDRDAVAEADSELGAV